MFAALHLTLGRHSFARRIPSRYPDLPLRSPVLRRRGGLAVVGLAAVVLLAGLCGCSRLHTPLTSKYVYVTAKQAFLRDRVAALVSPASPA